MLQFIGMIIVGAIIGAIARLFMSGEQPIGILWTIILGAVGAALASWVLGAVWPSTVHTNGIDWIRWIVSIIFAIILISIYMSIRGMKKK